jgi:molecular chaperone GrpE
MTDPTARQGEEAVAENGNGESKASIAKQGTQNESDPVSEARRESAEFKDKLLRTLAEMENLRKRTEREVADARLYSIASFAREVLAVADNMHRALEAVDAELREHPNSKIQALVEGVELTERELLKTLEKHGVKKFSPEAEKFDPNVHQAMFELESVEVPPGHIAQVIQAGYMIGDRVLRPALVAVAKAPKTQAAANDNPTN